MTALYRVNTTVRMARGFSRPVRARMSTNAATGKPQSSTRGRLRSVQYSRARNRQKQANSTFQKGKPQR